MAFNILVQGFCPLKIKITQFPDGFRLNIFGSAFTWYYLHFSILQNEIWRFG